MGSFGLWHWLVVLVAVAVSASVAAGLIFVIVRAARAGSAVQSQAPRVPASSAAEHRLARLDELLVAGHITQVEHARQRAAVIASV